jgi:phosphoribosylformimino-5-aminoimidazole carboxamide ribonucleotide (ProFAR) isomerase
LRKWEREGAEIVHVVDLDAAHGRGQQHGDHIATNSGGQRRGAGGRGH